MFYRCRASVAFLVRSAAVVALVVVCLWATRVQSQPPGETKDDKPAEVPPVVEVFGKVVDAETGKPVEAFITQGGHFDPKDPKKVTWGFFETRTSSDSFSATIKWKEGWTARILADGYVPQPVLLEAPPAGKARIETVIRMKKGRIVRGRVLDHLGKPVADVSVFAARPTNGMVLVGGRAVNSYDGEEDKTVRGTKTDAEGRFELAVSVAAEPEVPASDPPAGDSAAGKSARPGLAVSSPQLDLWPAPLPEGNAEAIIRLPAPTRVEIRYDIEGGDSEASVFLQLVMHEVDAWKGFEVVRHIPIRNQGQAEITSLPPGRYQFARSRSLHHGNIGRGAFLDRQFVEVVSDKTTLVSFVRETGTRLKGLVEWDEGTKLTGVILSVRKPASPDASSTDRLFPHLFDARLLRAPAGDGSQEKLEIESNRGLFLTERIPPGTYEVSADGYAPLTPQQERRTGLIGPTLTAQLTVTVP
ncbi:MAG TPA: carboxypeptidase-like regulatory domain-containing protein, partial [Planctomycetaceae bacterium]